MCAKVVVQAGITKVVYDEEGGMEETYKCSEKTLQNCIGKLKLVFIIRFNNYSFRIQEN